MTEQNVSAGAERGSGPSTGYADAEGSAVQGATSTSDELEGGPAPGGGETGAQVGMDTEADTRESGESTGLDDAGVEALEAGESGGEESWGEESESSGSGRVGGRKAQLEREGEVAADFLETLLDIADLDGDLDVDIEGDRAAVAIVDSEEGRVPRRLVGQDGRVLEALQELTRLAVQSATGERSRLMLDIAGHRAERRSALVNVARTAITQVRESGQSESLEPMSAFERKVIHDEVLAAGLVSESDGVEPRRFVVIHPA